VTKQILGFFASDIVAKGVSAALIPLYSYLLGAEELGQFSEWFSIYSGIVAVMSFGIPTYLLVLLSAHASEKHSIVEQTSSLLYEVYSVAVPLIVCLSMWKGKFFYGFTISIAAVSFSIVNYLESILRYDNKTKQYLILQIASTACTNVVPLVFVFFTASWLSRALGFTISVAALAVAIVGMGLVACKHVKIPSEFRSDAFKFGLPVVLISAISWLKLGIDVQLLKGYSGYKESGILFFSFQIISIVTILAASLNRASTTDFLRFLSAGEHGDFVKLFTKMMLLLSLMTMLVVIGTMMLTKTYLKEFDSSASLILPMAIGSVFYGAGQFISVFFLYHKKTYLLTLCIGLSSTLHPFISYYIIGELGWMRIGYSYLISHTLFLVMVLYTSKKLTSFSFRPKSVYS